MALYKQCILQALYLTAMLYILVSPRQCPNVMFTYLLFNAVKPYGMECNIYMYFGINDIQSKREIYLEFDI